MFTIKIYNEFIHSPIWTYDENGLITSDLPIIKNDEQVKEICEKAEELYSSYFEFDFHDEACWFNEEQEKTDKEIMLSLIHKLISRLNEINDGSFVIEDCETERLEKL